MVYWFVYSYERQVFFLRDLIFQSVMDFYKSHNRKIYRMILEAQRNGTLSPFVGAGLSVPFGYQQWGGALKELAENIIDGDLYRPLLKLGGEKHA